VPAARADGCRRRASLSVCGSRERAADGLGGAPGSHPITDACGLARGHTGIELRRRPPLDLLRPDSAPKPRVLATGEISPASFPVSAAGSPTRRTACSFSPAVSLRRCRSATTDLSRARRRSRCPGLCCHGSSSTHGELLQGNQEESERICWTPRERSRRSCGSSIGRVPSRSGSDARRAGVNRRTQGRSRAVLSGVC